MVLAKINIWSRSLSLGASAVASKIEILCVSFLIARIAIAKSAAVNVDKHKYRLITIVPHRIITAQVPNARF